MFFSHMILYVAHIIYGVYHFETLILVSVGAIIAKDLPIWSFHLNGVSFFHVQDAEQIQFQVFHL